MKPSNKKMSGVDMANALSSMIEEHHEKKKKLSSKAPNEVEPKDDMDEDDMPQPPKPFARRKRLK